MAAYLLCTCLCVGLAPIMLKISAILLFPNSRAFCLIMLSTGAHYAQFSSHITDTVHIHNIEVAVVFV